MKARTIIENKINHLIQDIKDPTIECDIKTQVKLLEEILDEMDLQEE